MGGSTVFQGQVESGAPRKPRDPIAVARMQRMIVDVLREIAAESGTGHIGSEHVGLLAIRGDGGLAELTGMPADEIAASLRRECRLARETPVDRPSITPRTLRLVRNAITLAEMRGRPAPTAAELVGALLNEPSCEAWADLARVGVSARQVEAAQRAAFGQVSDRRRAPKWIRPPLNGD